MIHSFFYKSNSSLNFYKSPASTLELFEKSSGKIVSTGFPSDIRIQAHRPHNCKYRILVFVLLVLLCTILTGCLERKSLPTRIQELLTTSNSTVLRLGIYGDPLDLNPILSLGEFGRLVVGLVHAAPLKRAADGTFQSDLFATFIPTQDENGNLVVEGAWRNDLIWHDGVSFSPKDFEFTLHIMAASDSASPYADLARRVTSIQHFDRGRRTRIVFSGNSVQFLDLLTVGILPAHLLSGQNPQEAVIALPPYVIEDRSNLPIVASPPQLKPAGTLPHSDAASSSSLLLSGGQATTTSASVHLASQPFVPYSFFPVGMGPYRIISRQRARYIELEPSPAFAASAPFRKIIIRCFSRIEDLVSAFRNGHLDWINVPFEVASRLEELKIPGVKFVRTPNPACLVLGLNTHRPPFDRLPVRRALSAAINRRRLLDSLLAEGCVLEGPPAASCPLIRIQAASPIKEKENSDSIVGLASGATLDLNLMHTSSASYSTGDKACENPSALLAEAGLVDIDGDGWRELDGKPFSFTILTNQSNLSRKVIGEQIAEDLKKVGIKASVSLVNWSDLLGKYLSRGDFEAYLIGLHIPQDRSWINLWHSSPPVGDRLNFTGFFTPELDRALEDWDRVNLGSDNVHPSNSPVERVRAILTEQLPVIWLVQSVDVMAFKEELHVIDSTRSMLDQDVLTWSKQPSKSTISNSLR